MNVTIFIVNDMAFAINVISIYMPTDIEILISVKEHPYIRALFLELNIYITLYTSKHFQEQKSL